MYKNKANLTAAHKPDNKLRLFRCLYSFMLKARLIDFHEKVATSQGKAFFHVSGAGHEGLVALAPHLIAADWKHCHYRDKSLMLALGVSPEQFFNSLFCNNASHSKGRQMSAHMSDPDLNLLSIVGPVGNHALQSVGIARSIKNNPDKPLVLCAMGDGCSQQGEVLEAIAEAVRWTLPVLFVIEDNHYSISTKTQGNTFYSLPSGQQTSFYGIPLVTIDGSDVVQAHHQFEKVVHDIREHRAPKIVIFSVERLHDHTNADDQRQYRSDNEIEKIQQTADPILHLAQYLQEKGMSKSVLERLERRQKSFLQARIDTAYQQSEPKTCYDSKCPDVNVPSHHIIKEYTGNSDQASLSMKEAINGVLNEQLLSNPTVSLYGQDIEDPKGDVFGVTKGLSSKYPDRVVNSPLSESSIIGVSIGRALVGEKPVAFLQFADFLPLAFNQICNEMASMYWRTEGRWQCPVIVMLACGGYRPGLGPFHAQTMESIAAHVPGLDVIMPSNAGDAAGLLNAAFASQRPTLFFYPKSCLNASKYTSDDVNKHLVSLGKARIISSGSDLTLVGYGSTISLCEQVVQQLQEVAISVELIDLRCLSPWDYECVFQSVKKTGKLLVTHEDSGTISVSSEILASIGESLPGTIMARVTRADTFIPCNFSNQMDVLPSFRTLLEKAASLLNVDVNWQQVTKPALNMRFVKAIGSSPTDETILLSQWYIGVGDKISKGDLLADFEASKASSELLSQEEGWVTKILVGEGETVTIGTPLLCVQTDGLEAAEIHQEAIENRPVLTKLAKQNLPIFPATNSSASTQRTCLKVGIAHIASALGSKTVANEAFVFHSSQNNTSQANTSQEKVPKKDIAFLTGIKSRQHAGENENVLTLGVQAARRLLKKSQLTINDIDMVLVSTGTPLQNSPSLACMILDQLTDENKLGPQAHDINAACSGYLYALQNAYDYLQMQPDHRVLLITSEVISPLLDSNDFATAPIFGDAATASLILGENHFKTHSASIPSPIYRLRRPELSTRPESGKLLFVPLAGTGEVLKMNGNMIFTEAVRKMSLMLEKCCSVQDVPLNSLDIIVPHQANQRILDAVASRMSLSSEKVFSNIAHLGNTSSSSIPLALEKLWSKSDYYNRIGLCAFGGGFTFAACILDKDHS